MRSVLLCCSLVLGSLIHGQSDPSAASMAATRAGLSAGDWASIRASYEAGRYRAFSVEGGHRARNPEQRWTTLFDGRGFRTTPDVGEWSWGLELLCFGWGEEQRVAAQPQSVAVEGGRVAYAWEDALTEWYVNDRRGLEHGYTVHARPADAEGRLTLALGIRGELAPELSLDGRDVRFVDARGGAALTYSGLSVRDADDRELPAGWRLRAGELRLEVEDSGARYPLTIDPLARQAYLKASNSEEFDAFGWSVAISGDTVVVGAPFEDSGSAGVNGDQSDNSMYDPGAAYVFVRQGTTWSQQAYLKASNPGFATGHYPSGDQFGHSVAISGDTLVVGARGESSDATGVNGDPTNDNSGGSGAAYVFKRSGTSWNQQAYLKASNNQRGAEFGFAVGASGDTVVVAAIREDRTPGGPRGVAYVFVRVGATWSQQARLSDSTFGEGFGWSLALSGPTLVVGAPFEASRATGVNGDPNDGGAYASGAAYVLVRSGTTWLQQAYLKASNTTAGDEFGRAVAIDGDTVVVGAWLEDSSATGVDGDQNDDGAENSGAAYVFARSGTSWSQQAYLKASNTGGSGAVSGDPYGDRFGWSVAVSGDRIVVGAPTEDSDATDIDGDGSNDLALDSGAAYVFGRDGGDWTQRAYVKAVNTDARDEFGFSVAVSGDTFVVGAYQEDGNARGVDGDPEDDSASYSGAAYVLAMEDPGCLVLDFESEDDWATPLVNGQHVDTEFGRLVTLTSSGPNAGLALFDATPFGPNYPGQDLDLLVGGGNLLILQTENDPPDADDLFPHPNDDQEGGVMAFDFALPVEARKVRLVDIDATDRLSSLVLVDASARRRTFWIPAGWTGDRTLGEPGRATLDLGTLLPQPGFGSTVTGAQDAGFEPDGVVRIEFHLNGSGALDDLELCLPQALRAAVLARHGRDVNPIRLTCSTLPVLGGTWRARLDCGGSGGLAFLALSARREAWMSPFGELLIAGPFHSFAVPCRAGTPSAFVLNVPHDLSLCGREFFAQGACHEQGGGARKVRRARVQLSNALDLVLGF